MSQQHEISYISPSQLVPYERNSNTHSDWQIKKIADSIREFGFTQPVLANPSGKILAGHGRVLAAIQVGLDEVPVITLDLTEAQFRAYVIADNQLARLSEWDHKVLADELLDLKNLDVDLNILGFDDKELAKLQDLVPDAGWPDGNDEENPYTKKIEPPIYEPRSETQPNVSDVYDTEKTESLEEKILDAEIPQDVKNFLIAAAARHTVFNYETIAEYYAHAPKEIQELMEDSALVIIDLESAIENGFVNLSKDLADSYLEDKG